MDERKKTTNIAAMPLFLLSEARRRFGPEYEVGRDFFVTSEDMDAIYCRVVDSYLFDNDGLKSVAEFMADTDALWRAAKMFIRERKDAAYNSYFLWKNYEEADTLEPLLQHLEHDLRSKTAQYLGKRLPAPTNQLAGGLPNLPNMTPEAADEFERVLDSISHREFALRVYAAAATHCMPK